MIVGASRNCQVGPMARFPIYWQPVPVYDASEWVRNNNNNGNKTQVALHVKGFSGDGKCLVVSCHITPVRMKWGGSGAARAEAEELAAASSAACFDDSIEPSAFPTWAWRHWTAAREAVQRAEAASVATPTRGISHLMMSNVGVRVLRMQC